MVQKQREAAGWKRTLVQAGAFIAVVVIAFAAAVPLANDSVRRAKRGD